MPKLDGHSVCHKVVQKDTSEFKKVHGMAMELKFRKIADMQPGEQIYCIKLEPLHRKTTVGFSLHIANFNSTPLDIDEPLLGKF